MGIDGVLRAARAHWWLVLATLAVTLGCAGLLTTPTVPQYATTVTFFVTTPSQSVIDSYHGGLFSKQRITSYAYLLKSGLADAVARGDGIGLTPAQVRSRITSRGLPDSVLIEATVTDSDRVRSERIANLLSNEFVSLIEKLETPPGQSTSAVKLEMASAPRVEMVLLSRGTLRILTLLSLLGLVLGVVAAVVWELLEVTVKTPEVLRQVTGAPVLAVVPLDRSARRTPLVVEGAATRRAVRWSRAARRDAFQQLRRKLQFVDAGVPTRMIMITSSDPAEGKSMTAVNLAIAFVEAGRRVALVEADRRKPRVAEYLGLDGARGLSNVLNGEAPIDTALQRWGSSKLYVLPAGTDPPKRAVLVASGRMAALLQRLREAFDVVIVDTPPVRPFTDAAVVSTIADGAVLVVRSGKTRRARIRMAVASLRADDSRLLGCVLNMHGGKAEGYYYPGGRRRSEKGESDAVPATLPAPAAAPTRNSASPPPYSTVGSDR